jgi:hypothetical protein
MSFSTVEQEADGMIGDESEQEAYPDHKDSDLILSSMRKNSSQKLTLPKPITSKISFLDEKILKAAKRVSSTNSVNMEAAGNQQQKISQMFNVIKANPAHKNPVQTFPLRRIPNPLLHPVTVNQTINSKKPAELQSLIKSEIRSEEHSEVEMDGLTEEERQLLALLQKKKKGGVAASPATTNVLKKQTLETSAPEGNNTLKTKVKLVSSKKSEKEIKPEESSEEEEKKDQASLVVDDETGETLEEQESGKEETIEAAKIDSQSKKTKKVPKVLKSWTKITKLAIPEALPRSSKNRRKFNVGMTYLDGNSKKHNHSVKFGDHER